MRRTPDLLDAVAWFAIALFAIALFGVVETAAHFHDASPAVLRPAPLGADVPP